MSVTQTQIMVSPPSAPGSASVTKSKGSTEDKNNEKLMVRYFFFMKILTVTPVVKDGRFSKYFFNLLSHHNFINIY